MSLSVGAMNPVLYSLIGDPIAVAEYYVCGKSSQSGPYPENVYPPTPKRFGARFREPLSEPTKLLPAQVFVER